MSLDRILPGLPLGDEVHAITEELLRAEGRDLVQMKKMLSMHYF